MDIIQRFLAKWAPVTPIVGDYDPNRLANLGIGHGAIDFGGGYTSSVAIGGKPDIVGTARFGRE